MSCSVIHFTEREIKGYAACGTIDGIQQAYEHKPAEKRMEKSERLVHISGFDNANILKTY